MFTDSDTWDDVEQSNLANYLSSFIADVITARAYVFGFGFGVATLVAFLYIGLLQIPFLVAILVWSCVLLVLLCLLGLGYGLWVTAVDWDDAGTKEDVSCGTVPIPRNFHGISTPRNFMDNLYPYGTNGF